MSQGIRHAPFTTFSMISSLIAVTWWLLWPRLWLGLTMSLNRSYFQLYWSWNSLLSINALGNSLKLNLSLTFYSLSCVNMSKISWTLKVRGEIPESNRDYNRFSYNLYIIKQFRVQEAQGSKRTSFLFFYFLMSCFLCFRHPIAVSPERRCSSRTFRYGYLVTT